MSASKNFNISVVIPVYNEAENINACLDALAAQKLPVHEVIVVDNNSTDSTSLIAKEYNFVKLVCESRQGVGYARDKGFRVASGDILARLDADSVVAEDWSENIAAIFESGKFQAITGPVRYYGFRYDKFADYFDFTVRRIAHTTMPGMPFLLGSNMAILKNAWMNVQDNVCMSKSIHEDIDLAIHMQRYGYNIGFCKNVKVAISSRRYHSKAKDLTAYCLALPRTYLLHDSIYFIPCLMLVFGCLGLYLPIRKLLRLLSPVEPAITETRVDPTTNIV